MARPTRLGLPRDTPEEQRPEGAPSVRRQTYDSSGRSSLNTSHDNAAMGPGAVVNEVKQEYDGWGNLTSFKLDRDSAVSGSGFYEVGHTFTTATTGRNTLRRTTSTQPDGATIRYNGASSASLHAPDASRVSYLRLQIDAGSNVRVAGYQYNGPGDVVELSYPQSNVFWRQQDTTVGDSPDRGRFDRIIRSRWTEDLSTDVDFFAVEVGYDRSSNIVSTEDGVYPAGFDVKYALDNLDRLTDAAEGTLSGGSIASRTRRQQWTLTQTGNWDREKLDLNGDGDRSDTGEHDETRTHNEVNEILTRDTNSSPPAESTLIHDAAGNLTDDGESYTLEYDPWYRLRRMRNRSIGALVAEHTYYGNGFRAGEKYDDDDVDGDVDVHDQTYLFAYDERWGIVATFRGLDSALKKGPLGGWWRHGRMSIAKGCP